MYFLGRVGLCCFSVFPFFVLFFCFSFRTMPALLKCSPPISQAYVVDVSQGSVERSKNLVCFTLAAKYVTHFFVLSSPRGTGMLLKSQASGDTRCFGRDAIVASTAQTLAVYYRGTVVIHLSVSCVGILTLFSLDEPPMGNYETMNG